MFFQFGGFRFLQFANKVPPILSHCQKQLLLSCTVIHKHRYYLMDVAPGVVYRCCQPASRSPVGSFLAQLWGTSASLQSFTPQRWPLNPCCCIWSYWLCHYCETALEIFMYLLKTIIHWYDPKEAPQHIWIHIFRFGLITRFVVYLGKVLVLDQTGSVALVFGVVDGSDSHWTFLFHKYKCGKQKTVKTTKCTFVYDTTSFWSEKESVTVHDVSYFCAVAVNICVCSEF